MRGKLSILGLVLFVIADVALVTLAFRHVQPVEPDTTPTPTSEVSPSDSTSTSKGPSERPKQEETDTPAPTAGQQLLSLAGDGTVLRATRGSCADDQAPEVELSTDGGRTFEPVTVAPGLSEVLGVDAVDAENLRVVGTAAACESQSYDGAVGDTTWEAGPDAVLWHLVRGEEADESVVRSPEVVVKTPCPPVNVTAAGGVRLLCGDGRVFGTANAGAKWDELGTVEGATAIAFAGPEVGYALAEAPDCTAQLLTTDDGGGTWAAASCLGDQEPRAIATNGDAVIAQVGDTLRRLTDAALSGR